MLAHAKKQSFQQWIGLQTSNIWRIQFPKIIHLDFITNRATAIIIVIIGIHLYLSFQIDDFGVCDAKDAATAATATTTALTLFHTIYHRIRLFTCKNLINMGHMHVRACVCLRPFIRYSLLFSLSISSVITHKHIIFNASFSSTKLE